jgi:hypothetical protein
MKQIAILADIRNKYILGKDYHSPKKSKSKPKYVIKSREMSKGSSSQVSHDQNFSNIKLARILSKTKS